MAGDGFNDDEDGQNIRGADPMRAPFAFPKEPKTKKAGKVTNKDIIGLQTGINRVKNRNQRLAPIKTHTSSKRQTDEVEREFDESKMQKNDSKN